MANFLGTNNNQLLKERMRTNYFNKRMYLRYEFEKEIKYVLHYNTGQCFEGVIIDISESGV